MKAKYFSKNFRSPLKKFLRAPLPISDRLCRCKVLSWFNRKCAAVTGEKRRRRCGIGVGLFRERRANKQARDTGTSKCTIERLWLSYVSRSGSHGKTCMSDSCRVALICEVAFLLTFSIYYYEGGWWHFLTARSCSARTV